MSREIRVEDTVIEASVTRIDAAIDEMQRLLDDLERRAAVLRTEWSGEASDAYDRAHRDWDRSIRIMEKAARDVSAVAHSGTKRFRAMDEAHARVWSF
ncbi:WXG100 family type VII secretion target [Leifsonia sp. YIM 134122]|uniref:ESAT-6-like protein n=1 Tax=Leifsonia stereocauli TaxID=3134136 RepID=A0ABU9W5T2_9MICO